jgi:hypothetical protein
MCLGYFGIVAIADEDGVRTGVDGCLDGRHVVGNGYSASGRRGWNQKEKRSDH